MIKKFVIYDIEFNKFFAGISDFKPYFSKESYIMFDSPEQAEKRMIEEFELYSEIMSSYRLTIIPIFYFEQ
jgi:hypothetical protein